MAEEIEIPEPPAKSSRMMLIVGVLIGLAVGVVGAFLMLKDSGDETNEAQEAVVEEQTEEKAAPAVNYVYLYIERMPAALMDDRGRTVGYVFLDLTLELLNGADQSFVSARMPRVKDALLRSISENGLSRPGTNGQLDFDRVSQYLLESANKAVEGNLITGVYITKALRAPS